MPEPCPANPAAPACSIKAQDEERRQALALGEEEDERRREELVRVLERAVEFSGRAQTKDGGWGYVSAKDGNDFD